MASAKDVEMTAHEETAEEHHQHVVERAQAGWRKVRAVKTVIGIRPWHKRHEKKIFLCGGFSATAVFVGIVALIATATAIAVVAAVLSDRAATAEEQALAKKQQSAAVNIAQRSVIPPKDENGDASRRLLSTTAVPRGLLRSVARSMERKLAAEETSQFAADSDFNTQSTSIYVYDRLSDSLRTANQIICMLSSSEAETLFDDGPFTAIFDSASCLGSQNSDSTSESKKIQTATWVVVPTAPDVTAETGNFELDAWLKIPSPGSYGSDMNVDFHLEVPKDKFITYNETINGETVQSVRAGDFTIKFRSARPNGGGYGTAGPEAGYGNDPGSSSGQFEGILTNRIVGTTETMYFQMNGGQDANVEVIADISTGEGYSLSGSTRYDYASSECMEAEMATGDMSTAANMEAHENAIREACFVKLTDQVSFLDDLVAVAGDSVTNGSTQCMDRSGYVNLGDSYGLYDADGTEVRVTTDVSIKKQVRYKGKTGVVYGVISPGNMWLWADYDYETNTEIFTDDDIQGPIREQFFADGATVQRNTWEWDPSTGMPAAYDPSAPTLTLKTVAGSMRVSAKVEKPLDEIDGIEFYSWSATLCPEGSAYQIARAQDAQHCQYYNATQDPYFETCMAHSQAYYFSESVIIWDASEQSWMKIREMDMGNKGNCNFTDGWNPNQSGYHQGPPQYTEINPAAPFNIDAADPWSDGVRFWSQELGGDAYIPSSASRVVELSISKKVDTSTKIQGQGDVLNLVCLERCINMTAVMEGKVPKNGQFSPDGYEDGYAMHPNHEDVRDKALSYTYTISTGKLIDSNGVVVSMPRPNMTCDGDGDCLQADDFFGLDMRLVLADDATFAELGCANATRDTCSDLFKASSYFEFRTHFDYERTSWLVAENGAIERPMEAKVLTADIPQGFSGRSLSGKSYAGKTIKFRFQQHWIEGLPKMCYDPESRAIKEPTTMGRGEGGVKYTSCWEDWNENPGSGQVYWEEVQDTVLPAGMSVTQTDVLSGTTTTYFMKPKRMRQIIPLTADQSACDSISSIPENAVATFNNVDLTDAMHFDMPARPTDAVLKVTVEGIICKYDPACAGSSAPAPAGN